MLLLLTHALALSANPFFVRKKKSLPVTNQYRGDRIIQHRIIWRGRIMLRTCIKGMHKIWYSDRDVLLDTLLVFLFCRAASYDMVIRTTKRQVYERTILLQYIVMVHIISAAAAAAARRKRPLLILRSRQQRHLQVRPTKGNGKRTRWNRCLMIMFETFESVNSAV